MIVKEVNFDGIVGPSHTYNGISSGNIASAANRMKPSNPKQAALQGLGKMKMLADLGVEQVVLPPHFRPDLSVLRAVGFNGPDEQILDQAFRESPDLLFQVWSASSMWTANAATTAPSLDTADGRVHITPANLVSQFHRSLEADMTARVFRLLLSDPELFVHHPPLPSHPKFGDEGAANHSRLAIAHGEAGVHLFVHGFSAANPKMAPRNFPARQSLEASQAVARLNALPDERVMFVQQHPDAIDAGVFHNDVIATANQNFLLLHENAFVNQQCMLENLRARMDGQLCVCEVPASALPLPDAVKSYLFNSQIVTIPNGDMIMIVPEECEEIPAAREVLMAIASGDNPIRFVRSCDLRQSMRNGGGPACLRLRVVLNERELASLKPSCRLTNDLYHRLCEWVQRHYRDKLSPPDLSDPVLLKETCAALDELTGILDLGPIYDFQR